jgi:hypothetical protein
MQRAVVSIEQNNIIRRRGADAAGLIAAINRMNFKRVAGSGRRVLKEASDRYAVQPLNDEAQGWSAVLSDWREYRDAPEGSLPGAKSVPDRPR